MRTITVFVCTHQRDDKVVTDQFENQLTLSCHMNALLQLKFPFKIEYQELIDHK